MTRAVALTNGYAAPRTQQAGGSSPYNPTGAAGNTAVPRATGYEAESTYAASTEQSEEAKQASSILAAFMANPNGLRDAQGNLVTLSEADVDYLLAVGATIPADGNLRVTGVAANGQTTTIDVTAAQLGQRQVQLQGSMVLNNLMQNPSLMGGNKLGAEELSYLLALGPDVPTTGTLKYTTASGGTYDLKPEQLEKLKAGKKIEIKDSKGKKFELKLNKNGEIEEKKKGGFFSFITKPFTAAWDGLKKVGGFIKDNWRTILAAVAIGALAIGTMGAGLSLAPAVLSAVSMAGTAANVALGVAGVVDGAKNGSILQMVVGGASAFAGVTGLPGVAKAVPALAKGAQYANMATQVAGGTAAAARGDWLGVATSAASFGASYSNLPGLRNIDPEKLKRAAQVTQAANGVNRARNGNLVGLASALTGAAALGADIAGYDNATTANINKYNGYATTLNNTLGGLGRGPTGLVAALTGAATFASTKVDGWGAATKPLSQIADYARTADYVNRAVKYRDVNAGVLAVEDIREDMRQRRLNNQQPEPLALNLLTAPDLDLDDGPKLQDDTSWMSRPGIYNI